MAVDTDSQELAVAVVTAANGCLPGQWLGADYVGGQGLLHPTGPGLVSHRYSEDEVKGDASCQFSFRTNSLAPRNPTKGLAFQEVEQHMALGCLQIAGRHFNAGYRTIFEVTK